MIPEILDHIFGFLYNEQDYTTLEACSDVYPEIVDRRLYSDITLYFNKAVSNKVSYYLCASKFFNILTLRPHVGNHVRVVKIELPEASVGGDSIPVISSILPMLPRIESIVLHTGEEYHWPTMDRKFCEAVRNSLRLPSIKTSLIANFNGFPLDTFEGCINLEKMLLFGKFIDGEDPCTSGYPRLCSLAVDNQPDFTRIMSWMKSNTLQTLLLRINHYDDFSKFRNLIEACSTTIVNLELSNSTYPDIAVDDGTLPELQLPVLAHVTFRTTVFIARSGPCFFCIPLLLYFLNISTDSPILLSLHFQLQFPAGFTSTDLSWSFLIGLLIVPIFRHIHLHFALIDEQEIAYVVSSFERRSKVKKLLDDKKLTITYNTTDSAIGPGSGFE